jgi:hypothetical protein
VITPSAAILALSSPVLDVHAYLGVLAPVEKIFQPLPGVELPGLAALVEDLWLPERHDLPALLLEFLVKVLFLLENSAGKAMPL